MGKFQLPADSHIGAVYLGVSDLARAREFYCNVLGFRLVAESPTQARLSASGKSPHQIVLDEIPNAIPQPPGTTGLFHTAIRLSERGQLGLLLARLNESRWPIQGFADHKVSEAIYLADPDGLGVELYTDRPRQVWPWMNRQVQMTTDPLDVESLLRQAEEQELVWEGIPDDTDIGHVHLRVSDLRQSRRFYSDKIGLDITQENYPGAVFLSAGGYHHHIGLNIWGSRKGQPPPSNSVGLRKFSLDLPDERAVEALRENLLVQDPSAVMKKSGATEEVGFSIADSNGFRIAICAENGRG